MSDVEMTEADVAEEASSAELVPASATTAIIQAEDPDEILAKAGRIAKSLTDLVEKQGFAVKLGGKKPHLEIGAWQALGALLAALGGQPLHAEVVPGSSQRVTDHEGKPERTIYHVHEKRRDGSVIDYDVEGSDWQACVEVKMPNGTVVGRAEAMCSRAEPSWMRKPDPALKSMAETRAASRAFRHAVGWIVAIAGYNPTPAEEMPPVEHDEPPPFGPSCPPEELERTKRALQWLLKNDTAVAELIGKIVGLARAGDADGYLSRIAINTAGLVAAAVKANTQPAAGSIEPPKLTGEGEAADLAALRQSGCICTDPFSTGEPDGKRPGFDDKCPIRGHGIPF